MLDNFANFVNNYKIKYRISILSTIRRSKTATIVFKVIVLIILTNIIVSILLLKKRSRLSKIAENALISKKKENYLKLRLL